MNISEELVKEYSLTNGYNIQKLNADENNKGIPDFYVNKNNEYFYVEVKNEKDKLKRHQIETIKFLHKNGNNINKCL